MIIGLIARNTVIEYSQFAAKLLSTVLYFWARPPKRGGGFKEYSMKVERSTTNR